MASGVIQNCLEGEEDPTVEGSYFSCVIRRCIQAIPAIENKENDK